MDCDASTNRDVADNLVARHRRAALCHAYHHTLVFKAIDNNAVRIRRQRTRPPTATTTWRRLGRNFLGPEVRHQLLDHLRHGDLASTNRDVKFFSLAIAHLAHDSRQDGRRGDALRW